jgi:hypothetical protein
LTFPWFQYIPEIDQSQGENQGGTSEARRSRLGVRAGAMGSNRNLKSAQKKSPAMPGMTGDFQLPEAAT